MFSSNHAMSYFDYTSASEFASCEPSNYPRQNFSVQEFNLPLGKPFSSKELPSKDSSAQSWRRPDSSYGNIFSPKRPTNNSKKPVPKFVALEKTEMCHFLDDYGSCPYGERCQYAHKESELRSVSRHPKYKTQVCRQFKLNGICMYGRRCQFIHEEANNKPQNNNKNYNNSKNQYNITLTFKPNQRATDVKNNNTYINNQIVKKVVDSIYDDNSNNICNEGKVENVGNRRLPVFVLLSQGILPTKENL